MMDAALGHAGGARGVGDHRDVVRARVGGLEALRLAVREARPRDVARPRFPDDDQLLEDRRGRPGPLELLTQAARDHGDPRPRILGDVGELPRAQQRHRRDRDHAELLAREPRDDELGAVRHSQQNAVPPVDAGGAEAVGEPVDPLLQVAVGEHLGLMVDRGPAGAAAVRVGVEQRRGDVEPNGIAGLRESGDSLRPERLWRETFLDRNRHPGPSCVRSQTTARRNGSQLRRVEQPMRARSDAGARFPAGAGPMYDEPRYGAGRPAPGVELLP